MLLACLTTALVLGPPGLSGGQERDEAALKRTADRLRALQKEADALASEQRTLLVELRKLELERQIGIEQVARIEQERQTVQKQIQAAALRADELAVAAASQLPEVEAQLVQLYKQGRAGYWRLLLSASDLQALGRAYRTAAMMTAVARARADEHYMTLDALAAERKALQARAEELETLASEARRARAAADKAVAARTALVNSIDTRRDLNAQLIGELQSAQERLQASLSGLGATGAALVPIGPFRGDLPWPVQGKVARPFGRQPDGDGNALVSNGVEIAVPEGQIVRAVHDGSVAFAGPFSGYGNLVIVDHGANSYSLYGYLTAIDVSSGQRVQPQARVGTSGRNPSGTPALYFELRVDGAAVDPVQWFRR
jgi:murein hydrolase activator